MIRSQIRKYGSAKPEQGTANIYLLRFHSIIESLVLWARSEILGSAVG
jgi:hypothetical protein